jgi:hypothetical protein
MTTIDLTESEMYTIWRLGSLFHLNDVTTVQDRQFTATIDGVTPKCLITVRAIRSPRWTLAVLPRYPEAVFFGDFSGNREAFDRDLFMLRMLWD